MRPPHELFYGEKPDVSHLRVYGCKAFAYVEKDHRDKLDAVSEECALVGYSATSKAYRLLRPGINGQLTVVEAISVRFHEKSPPSFLATYREENPVSIIAGGGGIDPIDQEYHPPDSEGDSVLGL